MRYITFALLAVSAFAQTPVQIPSPCIQQACFVSTTSATVGSSSATTLTIQQPASGSRPLMLMSAVVQCPGQAFTVDQAQNGTGATATAGTATALAPIQYVNQGNTPVAAAAKIFTASNVGAGSAVAPTLTFPSGAIAVIDLSQRSIPSPGITNNYSITLTNTGTGSCTGSVAFYWAEKI